jgi:hypothetical protein
MWRMQNTHLVLGVLRQHIQAADCEPELAGVRHLPYARPQVHQLLPRDLQACQPRMHPRQAPSLAVHCAHLVSRRAGQQTAHVCGAPHESLANIEDAVLVQPEDIVLVAALHQVLDALANELVQLLEDGPGLLLAQRGRAYS